MNQAMLKIVYLVSVFLFVAINVIVVTSPYEFVKCPGDNKVYPQGTSCEFTDDNLEEWEEKEDEEEHEEEEDNRN